MTLSHLDATGVDVARAEAVLETIRTRRSIGKVRPERPSKEMIQTIIEAAIHAPNHFLTQPWRFFVLTGKALEDLGDAMVRAEQAAAERDPSRRPANLEQLRTRPLRAPVIIALGVEPSSKPRVVEIEEISAAAAAAQNMLLAAHAQGLAAMWRTGDAAFAHEVKEFFGLKPDDHVLGFIYVGYPDITPGERTRVPAEEVTSWLGWDENSSDE